MNVDRRWGNHDWTGISRWKWISLLWSVLEYMENQVKYIYMWQWRSRINMYNTSNTTILHYCNTVIWQCVEDEPGFLYYMRIRVSPTGSLRKEKRNQATFVWTLWFLSEQKKLEYDWQVFLVAYVCPECIVLGSSCSSPVKPTFVLTSAITQALGIANTTVWNVLKKKHH